jgi:hypothetical protein
MLRAQGANAVRWLMQTILIVTDADTNRLQLFGNIGSFGSRNEKGEALIFGRFDNRAFSIAKSSDFLQMGGIINATRRFCRKQQRVIG